MACRQCPVLALKRWDRRDVVVLSTKHTPLITTVSVRARGDRGLRDKLMAVQDYNWHNEVLITVTTGWGIAHLTACGYTSNTPLSVHYAIYDLTVF